MQREGKDTEEMFTLHSGYTWAPPYAKSEHARLKGSLWPHQNLSRSRCGLSRRPRIRLSWLGLAGAACGTSWLTGRLVKSCPGRRTDPEYSLHPANHTDVPSSRHQVATLPKQAGMTPTSSSGSTPGQRPRRCPGVDPELDQPHHLGAVQTSTGNVPGIRWAGYSSFWCRVRKSCSSNFTVGT